MNHIGTRELATERLTLRRFELEDAENMFYNWANDPEVAKYLPWEAYSSAEQVEEYLKSQVLARYNEKDFYNWAIELNDLEQPIGNICVSKLSDEYELAMIEICIGKAYWNKGYAKEAIAEILRFLAGEVGFTRVAGTCNTENEFCGKAMQAAGMELEGVLKKAGLLKGQLYNMAVYAKVRSDAVEAEDLVEEEKPQSAVATKVVDENGVEHNFISDETMEYVGILAKLELSPEEAEAAKKDMADMLDYIDKLNELDVSGIEPMSHVFPVNNVFRADVVTNGDGSQATLKNAPVMKDGGFKVPKTIGE